MSPSSRGFDLQAMLQELRTNRKTQAALVAFALILGYALYTFFAPDAPKNRRATTAGTSANLDPRQLQGLRRLPDLAALDKAGELPPNPKVQRDLFMFEAPPAPVVKVKPPPPPPPPTEAELAQQRLAQEKAAEFSGRPQDLRYLGFFKGTPAGTVGAFMKGEEPVTLVQGTLLKERWKLITILDTRAEFQNTKYPDLRLVLEAREASGGAAVNQF
jgi:type IV secretory pathway VirB10-like protein